jgi:hypothetical protein
MDFETARTVGDEGERVVSQALQRLAARHGFRQLDNLVLEVKPMTGQLDHVIVDRHGVLVLESKVRRDALIKGNDAEKRWTACYRSGAKKSFLNPLAQNREHENLLRQALRNAKAPVDPDYIESAVVFAGADLAQLDLKSSERARVIDLGDLERLFAERDARPSPREAWSSETVDYWWGLLATLDRSLDPGTLQRHSEYRGGGPSPASRGAAPVQPRVEVRGGDPSAALRSARSAFVPPGRAVVTRYQSSSSNRAARELRGMLMRVVLAVVFLGSLWLCGVSGLADLAIRGLTALLVPRAVISAPAASAIQKTRPSLQTAKQRLQEVAPDVASAATDLDDPQVSQSGDETTFTWHYISKPKPNTAVIKTFWLVLGPDGSIRSMGAGK